MLSQKKEDINQIQTLLNQNSDFGPMRAKALAEKWAQNSPTDPYARLALGLCYGVAKKYDKALSEFRKARNFSPDLYLAWLNESKTLIFQGRYDESLEIMKQGLQLAPTSLDEAKGKRTMALALVEAGSFDGAVSVLQDVIALGMKDVMFGAVLLAQGKILDSLEALSESLHSPAIPDILVGGSHNEVCPTNHMLDFISEKFLSLLRMGFTPKQIQPLLTTPPTNYKPGTFEYVKWWKNETSGESWEKGLQESLENPIEDRYGITHEKMEKVWQDAMMLLEEKHHNPNEYVSKISERMMEMLEEKPNNEFPRSLIEKGTPKND
ncbi:MAG TPA: hypothetical protein DCE42_18785 [Myxococcales bacterium]|nr:hypothetical protein [Deltaproteobacteria bacterium]MBK07360.1 hypothetical protein [Deltaproteobacteria bacterium]MBU53515.1 hypothetical protein [Deltaproteobacteria bacterium]HAA56820.1 hypothetical protein [Myxococcales bacterium]|tara:strand:+ start:8467 stop:9435 length:969 start_codon:yes stop_codon:yes gene_type:complete